MGKRSLRVVVMAAFAASAWLPASALAQGIGFGITGGAIRSEVNSRGDESQNVALEHQSKANGGVFLTYPLSPTFWLQPEALLSVKGTQWNTGALEGQLRLTYLDVPLLLRFAGPGDAPVRVHVMGGPSLGILLNASSDIDRPVAAKVDVKDRYDSLDLGWVVGVGIGAARWHVDLRYGGSFSAITDEPELGAGAPPPPPGVSPTYRNRAFQFLAGVRLF